MTTATTPHPGGIPIHGGPWHGGTFWGGSPNERQCVITLRGGYYRMSGDGKRLEWVTT